MKINFTVPFRRVAPAPTIAVAPLIEPQEHAPRIARLLALAHKLDAMVRSGEIADYAQLARQGHISPARLTQIMVLTASGSGDPGIHSVYFRGGRPVRA
jgi:hypothetical protein